MNSRVFAILARMSRLYTRWSDPVAFLARSFIRRAGAQLSAPSSVCVDVGAGTTPYAGVVTRSMRVDHYFAADIAPTDKTALVADACRLPLRSDSVNLVVSFEVIQHIADPERFLDEVARVLAPGGCVLVTFPFLYAECDFRDYQRWTIEGMETLMRRHGLTPVLSIRRGGAFFAATCALNWRMQHLIPGQRTSWRHRRTWGGVVRSAVMVILTIPTNILGWLAIGLDAVIPSRGAYMGGGIVACKSRDPGCGV